MLGPVVDVSIGLVLVYLLLGLITTAFQEVLTRAIQLRGTKLRNALIGLLANGDESNLMFQTFFNHALIRGTARNGQPSYIPSRNFAMAMIDILNDGSQSPIFSQVENSIASLPRSPAKESLQVFLRHAAGDLDVLKAHLATWYDDAMDRLTGEYKRFSQTVALVCGLVFAVMLNVDTINIAQTLWTNEAARAAAVALAAEQLREANGELKTPELNQAIANLKNAQLPIGWPAGEKDPRAYAKSYFGNLGLPGTILVIIGWLITALATSLGAPFWFDTLQRLFSLRSTGPKPPRQNPSETTPKS